MAGRTVKKESRKKAAKPAVQSLREFQPAGSQAELEAAFNSITELVMLLNSDCRIKWANKATSDFLKLPLTEITGKYCYTLMHGTDKPVENCPLAKMIKSRKHEEGELYLTLKRVWARVTVDPQYDTKGNLVSVVHTVNDVTERKKAEEALRESEEKYRTLIEKANEAIIIVQDGNFVFVNRRMCELLGVPEGYLEGKPFVDYVWPEDRELVLANYRKRISGETATDAYDFRIIDAAGMLTWVYVSGARIQWEGRPASISLITDINKRKHAEEALQERESQYRWLSEHITDGVWLLDMNLKPTYQSPSMEKLTGFTHEELMELPFEKRVTPESLNLAAELFLELMPRIIADPDYNPTRKLELEYYCKDGTILWTENKLSGIRDENSNPQFILNEVRDITERKRAEEALRKSEERFRNMANLLPQVVFEADEKGTFTFVNRQGFEMFGYSESDIAAGINVLDAISLRDRDRAAENVIQLFNGEKFPSQEYAALRKDGREFPIAIYASPIMNNSRCTGMRGIVINMTEHNRIEAALRESEEKYRLLVENAHEAIILAVEGTVRFANRSAMEMSGYSLDELASRSFIDFIHPDDRSIVAERYLQRIKGLEAPSIYSFRIMNKSGDFKWAEVSVALVTWEGRPATLNFLTDITDHKRLEEEQQRVEKLESIGLLAGGIAHDFNNILTAILGNISLARMEATPGSEVLESLEQAEKASLRARDLTRQLLTFSKGGAPVLKLASLTELLKDTTRFALRGSNVKCHFSIPDDLWHAEIDAGQVSQVIHNLVINAQQAMPAGGTIDFVVENIILSETQSLGRGLPLKEGKYVRIAITDQGSGIPAEDMAKIFDPFFTTKKGGSGLGLATSFSIARHHGGHLSVESEPGSGSTFYLYLPASMETPAPRQHKKERIKYAGKARILVMDDEKGVREVAGRMLKHIGYEDVEFAADGSEAVRRYSEAVESGQPFNVVMLDLTVPGGMGGRETIKQLLEVDPGVRAIVSSGYAEESVMAEYTEYGFCGMVAKPYSIEQLGKTIQDVIG